MTNIDTPTPKINRRSILTAAAVVPFAAVPAMATVTQNEIQILFSEWKHITGILHNVSDDECERGCERLSAIEAEMIALPTSDITDLAAKLIVHTGGFAFASTGKGAAEFQSQVWALLN